MSGFGLLKGIANGSIHHPSMPPVGQDAGAVAQDNAATAKVGDVYNYVAKGLVVTGFSAYLSVELGATQALLGVLAASPWIGGFALFAGAFALLYTAESTPMAEIGKKAGAFYAFSALEGVLLGTLVLINRAVFAKAFVATTLLTAALGYLANTMGDNFLQYESTLMMGMFALSIASFGSLFLWSSAAAFFHEIVLIGGLALFTGFILYDTQKARQDAIANPDTFDPIHHAIKIYTDVIPILIRIFELWARHEANNQQQQSN